ncbi:condensation domain-containing protein [Phytohabitans houttuyneae]|uniref:condensation domain-containing protein n=1 Tax=Phytohabitans houttuyneae TaxID=1076126 RepID=UPI001564330E|nr:condensation domain-containing protein [Phytohabitans houttuyneae]
MIQIDDAGTVSLTPLPAVPVAFAGGSDAEGPYTLGQLNIKVWLDQSPDHCYSTLKWRFDVPEGTTLAEVAAAAGALVTRHEGLRTRFLGGDVPTQRVTGSGELPIEVWSLDERQTGPVDQTALDYALLARLAAGIGPDAPLPLRVAVAVQGELVRAAVMVFSHLAVDFQAMTLLGREFTALLREPGHQPAEVHQPLAQAEAEADPRARRRAEAAIRHWERHLRQVPQCLYARPRTGPAAGGGIAQLTSPAGAAALRHIAARTRASRPTIVFAALCAVLARRTGYRECRFPILSGNRFESRLERYIGTLAQSVLVRLDTTDAGFDELVRRAFGAMLSASRNGAWDAGVAIRLHRRVAAERGLRLRFEPLFNNLVVDSSAPEAPPEPVEALAAAASGSQIVWSPAPPTSTLLRFDLWQVDGALLFSCWSSDTGRADRNEAESLLLAVERLLLAAAGADLDAAAVGPATGLEPIARGPGWLFVDSCWVELDEVRRLLDDALGAGVAQVFAEPAGPDTTLVAYVDGSRGEPASPEQLHARCLAALSDRLTAMTPQRYVICDGTPPDPTDPAGWRLLPVLAEGTGRQGLDLSRSG